MSASYSLMENEQPSHLFFNCLRVQFSTVPSSFSLAYFLLLIIRKESLLLLLLFEVSGRFRVRCGSAHLLGRCRRSLLRHLQNRIDRIILFWRFWVLFLPLTICEVNILVPNHTLAKIGDGHHTDSIRLSSHFLYWWFARWSETWVQWLSLKWLVQFSWSRWDRPLLH